MRVPVRPRLLHVVAIALLAMQWSVATHAADHLSEPAHELCALCHIAQDASTPPTTDSNCVLAPRLGWVVDPLPSNPSRDIAWASRALRGPPHLYA